MSALNRIGIASAKPGRHARRDNEPRELMFPELHEPVDVDESPTQPIATARVVDGTPKPAQAPGLAPVPAPWLPAVVDEPSARGPRPNVPAVGAAFPARMTAWEHEILAGRSHAQFAQETREQNEAWQARIDRLAEYFRQVDERFVRGPEHYVREKTIFDLDQIGRRSAWMRQELVDRPYEFGPPRRARHALPRRVPGAALAAIEAAPAVSV
jgi:hypothetical protein